MTLEKINSTTEHVFIDISYQLWRENFESSEPFKLFVKEMEDFLKNNYPNVILKLNPYIQNYVYYIYLSNNKTTAYDYRIGHIFYKSGGLFVDCFLTNDEDGVYFKVENAKESIKKCFENRYAKEKLTNLNEEN